VARPGGLGKGLGALIPSGAAEHAAAGLTTGPGLQELPIAAIRPNPYQPRDRFDEEALGALADSIREVGLLQPVLVRPAGDGFELIAGERRWRAARRAGLQVIPALVRETADQHALEQALVENLQRDDLNPLEEAAAYQQMIEDFSMTHEQVASTVGKSRAAVTNTVRLLQLPPSIQRALREEQVEAERIVLATEAALAVDGDLLSAQELSEINEAINIVRSAKDSDDPERIHALVEALAHVTEEFASRRMDQSVRTALAGKSLDEI